MSLVDKLKSLFGVEPVSVRDLNRRATYLPAGRAPAPLPPAFADPLDGIEVTPEYERVKGLVDEGAPAVFVTGRAGTGKSVLVHYLRHALEKQVAVVAPTGVAALNVQGATLHSFCRLPPRVVLPEDVQPAADRRLTTKLDVLIVDEISMVRADVMDGVERFLRQNGRDPDRPFGGVQLVLVGDLFQLPPVVEPADERILSRLYASPYFFSADGLQRSGLYPVELTKVYRQADDAFVALLDDIRLARNVPDAVARINAACAGEPVLPALVTLTCTNAVADQLNASCAAALPGRFRVFRGETTGRFDLKDVRLPSPRVLELKPGAQVMFTRNDTSHRWVNGTLGRVAGFSKGSIEVELLGDKAGLVHDVQPVVWETFAYAYDEDADRIVPRVTGRYVQYPLMLAWAVTIHKGQGKTLERVRVDLGRGAFAPGQVYVALSRCRSLADLSLARPIEPREVRCDERIRRFSEGLARGAGGPADGPAPHPAP